MSEADAPGSRQPAGDAPGARRPAVRLLGKPACLDLRSGQWRDLPPKAAALLSLLITERAAPRARVATLLWPDADGDKPRVNLRGLLRDLRALAGCELVRGTDTLEPAADLLHDLQGAGPEPADTPATTPGELLAAFDYSALDEFDEWLRHERERRRMAAEQDLVHRALRYERAGQIGAAVAAARQLVGACPLDESAHQLLMRLLAQRGDRAAAREAFARCQKLLHAAGGQVSQPTRALATLIEMGGPLPGALPPSTPAAADAPRHTVAREAELAAVRAAWAQGQRVLLLGEPGVGKTRIVGELARGDAAAVSVSALAGDGDVPFATLVRLLQAMPMPARRAWPKAACDELSRLLPELGTPPPRPARLYRLTEALTAVLGSAATRGLALLLDDVQWSDAASMQLLLAAAAAQAGPRWLFAVRAGEASPALTAAIEQAPARWHPLTVSPLDRAGVEALLRAMPLPLANAPAWADALAGRTLGSPLHVIETVFALRRLGGDALFRGAPPSAQSLPVPAALDQLIDARVARLVGPERRLAQLAAVTGSLFSAPLAIRLMGLRERELELGEIWSSLEAEGVLKGSTLAHDSLRQPLLASVPEPVAQELHASIARAATELRAPAAEVARHWALAQCWEPAATAFEAAAEAAFVLGVRDAELALWDQAVACHERLSRSEAASAARYRAFDAALAVLPTQQAALRAQEIEALALTDAQQYHAAMAQARVALTLNHFDEGLIRARRAVELAAATGGLAVASERDRRWLRARSMLATALAGVGRHAEALAVEESDRDLSVSSGDPRLQFERLVNAGYVLATLGRFGESMAAYEGALALAQVLDDPSETMTSASNLAVVVLRSGDVRRALELAREAVATSQRIGQAESVAVGSLHMNLGVLAWKVGRFGEALVELGHAKAMFAACQAARWLVGCEGHLALAYVELGCTGLARAALQPWPADVTTGRLAHDLAGLAVDALAGQPVLSRLQALQAEPGNASLLLRLSVDLTLAQHLPPDEAATLCRSVIDCAAPHGLRDAEQAACLWLADALRRGGRAGEALPLVQAALARLERCFPLAMYLGRAWWIAHQVYAAAGMQGEATAVLRDGRSWVLHDALPHVPALHRRSFLESNLVNRALLLPEPGGEAD